MLNPEVEGQQGVRTVGADDIPVACGWRAACRRVLKGAPVALHGPDRAARDGRLRLDGVTPMTFERRAIRVALMLALALLLGAAPLRAQQVARAETRGKRTEAASQAEPGGGSKGELSRLRAQLAQTAEEYKSSLEQLLALYEPAAKGADERLAKLKGLYAQGLVTRSEVEAAEDAAARAGEKAAEVGGQLQGAGAQIAAALVEAGADEAAARPRPEVAPRGGGGLMHTTAYIRYGGARAWSLSEAGAVEQFFRGRFGRALPVSAFGQSPVHDRLGYGHHGAMDVAVSPDSAEGRALIEYLRAADIPFTAFRGAIPGAATGPHVHVGRPSHRIAPTPRRTE
jgi:hypothetical protein